jgi:hypothetical protein
MSFPLLTFASYLILVGPLAVRAQLSAPNCTDSSLAWVGPLYAEARFVLIPTCLSHRPGVFYSRTIRSNKIPAGSWRTWQQCVTVAVSACTPLAHRMQSH